MSTYVYIKVLILLELTMQIHCSRRSIDQATKCYWLRLDLYMGIYYPL